MKNNIKLILLSIVFLVILNISIFSYFFMKGFPIIDTEKNNENPVMFQSNLIQNNIQASHNDVSFELLNNKLIIKDIDNWVTLSGISMQPTVFTNNILIVRDYDFKTNKQLKEGQIIGFIDNQRKLTVHRIKGVYDDYYITQGDNNPESEKVRSENIQFVVVGVLYK